jgi:energy-coupling factor transporter ATP-binding protein EcfA2
VLLQVYSGESLLIMGPSGAGKTSVLRTLAGLWQSGSGSIYSYGLTGLGDPGVVTGGSGGVLFLPQKPYMVLGSLRDQLLYPTWARGRQEDGNGSSSSSNGSSESSSSSGGSNGNGEVTSSVEELRKATATPAKQVSGSAHVDCLVLQQVGCVEVPATPSTEAGQHDIAPAAVLPKSRTQLAGLFRLGAPVVQSTLVCSQPQLLQILWVACDRHLLHMFAVCHFPRSPLMRSWSRC